MLQRQFFCGLGVPKTGSTWLTEYLSENPDVFIPLIKELQIFSRIFVPELYGWMDTHFADNLAKRVKQQSVDKTQMSDLITLLADVIKIPFLENMPPKMKAYRRLFMDRVEEEILFGEFSTTYCLLPESGLRHLQATFNSPKFVLILRDPVDRYWSHLKHEIRQNKAFDPNSYALIDRPDSEFARMADYEEILTRLWNVLGRDNIHIIFYESLFVEKDEDVLRGLTDFLGIDYMTPDFDKVVYAGEDIELKEDLIVTLRQRFKLQYEFLEANFDSLPKGIRL